MLLAWQMAFGDNHVATIDPVTRSREEGAVKRSIAIFEKGVIVSYAVAVTVESTASVEISDTLPGNWDVDTVAFHPEHEPDDGTADRKTVEFTVKVDPEGYRKVKVGARPALDKTVEEVESDQSFSVPQIVNVKLVGGPDNDDSGSELIDRPSGASASADTATASSGATDPERGGSRGPGGSDESDDSDSILPSEDAVPTVGAQPSGGAPEVDPEEADSVRDLFGDFQEGATTRSSGRGSSPTISDSPSTTTQDSRTESTSSVNPTAGDTGDIPVVQPAEGSGRETRADDLLPQLLDELEGGGPSTADLERLQAILNKMIDDGDRSGQAQSTTVRVEKLEAKLEEFEAYTEALGDLVDSDDPADLLADIRTELDALRQEVSALQQDVKEVHDRQDTVEVRIESIVSDLENLLGSPQSH